MKHLPLLMAIAAPSLLLAAGHPLAGRWDITVTTPRDSYPQWMELVEKNSGPQIRIQPRGGAVRPAIGAKMESGRVIVQVSEAANNRPAVTWILTPAGGKFTGIQKTGDSETGKLAGVRAPALDRKPPKAWTKPEPLFNGQDLAGWEAIPGRRESKWIAKDGELINEDSGANLKTMRKFDDFHLHIEFNCPDHGNSGLYLRGRYEIQIGTEGGTRPLTEMGAIYGYYPQSKELPLRLGEWQSYDVTLIGRRVTVVRNGITIHDNVEIPGITGGALDSNETEPGPFFLQGDHQGRLRFRNIVVSVPVK